MLLFLKEFNRFFWLFFCELESCFLLIGLFSCCFVGFFFFSGCVRSDDVLFLFFLLFKGLFNLCNVSFKFCFLLFLFLKVKLIRFVLWLIDFILFDFVGGVCKFLFDGVGVKGFLYFNVLVFFECFWRFFDRGLIVLLEGFWGVFWKLNKFLGFFWMRGFGEGVDLFFFRVFSFIMRELGWELDDFFELCNMILEVVGEELVWLLSWERLSSVFFLVGFIGWGFVKFFGNKKLFLLLVC